MKLTAWQCFRSCFMVHNETANIWTHFLGAVFFVLLAFQGGCGSAPAPARTPPLEQVMSAPMGSADWSSTWQLAFPKQASANVPDSEEEWDAEGIRDEVFRVYRPSIQWARETKAKDKMFKRKGADFQVGLGVLQ